MTILPSKQRLSKNNSKSYTHTLYIYIYAHFTIKSTFINYTENHEDTYTCCKCNLKITIKQVIDQYEKELIHQALHF